MSELAKGAPIGNTNAAGPHDGSGGHDEKIKLLAHQRAERDTIARHGTTAGAQAENTYKERYMRHIEVLSSKASKLDNPQAARELCKALVGAPLMMKRDFSEDQRKKLADTGAAMKDGSYPIANGGDLENAVQAFGRAKDQDAVKAHIKSRARALGMTDRLPQAWKIEAAAELVKGK